MTEREMWLKIARDWDEAAHERRARVAELSDGLCYSIEDLAIEGKISWSAENVARDRLEAFFDFDAWSGLSYPYYWPRTVKGAACRAIAAALLAELVKEPLP